MTENQELIKLTVSEDCMTAVLEPVPEFSGKLTIQNILDVLNSQKIILGVDKQVLRKISEGGFQEGQPVVVAKGIAPDPGLDSEVIFCFRKQYTQELNIPEADIGSTGKFQLSNCKIAKKNEVLAIKLRSTEGKPGRDIYGRQVLASSGKDIPLDAGKNIQTRYYPDKIEYSALCEGIVRFVDGKLEVNSLCIIDHDVDLSTGNVEFVGSLLILGNVYRGFKVSSQGSIKIQGYVDGGLLNAEGDIIVAGSISGSSDIRSNGRVQAKFMEHSRVEATGNVEIDDGILHSEVISSGRVITLAGRGIVAGGVIKAKLGVDAKILGTTMASPTEIVIGQEFIENRNNLRMETELRSLDQEIQRLQTTLRPFVGKDPTLGTLPADKRWALKSLAKRLQETRNRRNMIRQRLATYDELIPTRGSAGNRINVHGNVYPGVTIRVGSQRLEIDHILSGVTILKSPVTNELAVTGLEER